MGKRVHSEGCSKLNAKGGKMPHSQATGSPSAGSPSSQFLLRHLPLLSYSGFWHLAHSTLNRAASAEKRLTSNLAPAPSRRNRSWASIFSQKAPRSHSACAEDSPPGRLDLGRKWLRGAELGRRESLGVFIVLQCVVFYLFFKKVFIKILLSRALFYTFRDSLVNNTPGISPRETYFSGDGRC